MKGFTDNFVRAAGIPVGPDDWSGMPLTVVDSSKETDFNGAWCPYPGTLLGQEIPKPVLALLKNGDVLKVELLGGALIWSINGEPVPW